MLDHIHQIWSAGPPSLRCPILVKELRSIQFGVQIKRDEGELSREFDRKNVKNVQISGDHLRVLGLRSISKDGNFLRCRFGSERTKEHICHARIDRFDHS